MSEVSQGTSIGFEPLLSPKDCYLSPFHASVSIQKNWLCNSSYEVTCMCPEVNIARESPFGKALAYKNHRFG